MINNKINVLRKKFIKYQIDGYVYQKMMNFFQHYQKHIKFISNLLFCRLCINFKEGKLSFVDGRYTIQADIEFGKNFKIINLKIN